MTIAPLPPCPSATEPLDRSLADLPIRLGWYRHGRGDPTTHLWPTGMVRAMFTEDGPAAASADWSTGRLAVQAWGPGADRAVAAVHTMAAMDGCVDPLPGVHPLVSAAEHRFRGVWAGASGDLYHQLLPTIIAQRITGGEAIRQWVALTNELGERPPGPDLGLLLPPRPERLADRPTWWFHPLGIETKRARPLIEVARIADRLWSWAKLPLPDLVPRLGLVRGIGAWTIGSVLGPVCGDDDAVAVGDYHLPNLVAWNLAGEARADDRRMLSLLAPFDGQRGRVIRLLGLGGRRPPAFGPRQRILPMHRW